MLKKFEDLCKEAGNDLPPKDSNWYDFARTYDLGVVDLDGIAKLLKYKNFDDLDASISPRDLRKVKKKELDKALSKIKGINEASQIKNVELPSSYIKNFLKKKELLKVFDNLFKKGSKMSGKKLDKIISTSDSNFGSGSLGSFHDENNGEFWVRLFGSSGGDFIEHYIGRFEPGKFIKSDYLKNKTAIKIATFLDNRYNKKTKGFIKEANQTKDREKLFDLLKKANIEFKPQDTGLVLDILLATWKDLKKAREISSKNFKDNVDGIMVNIYNVPKGDYNKIKDYDISKHQNQ